MSEKESISMDIYKVIGKFDKGYEERYFGPSALREFINNYTAVKQNKKQTDAGHFEIQTIELWTYIKPISRENILSFNRNDEKKEVLDGEKNTND